MKDDTTIVSVSGYGYSGSGAVFDLLSEFSCAYCVEGEIPLLYFHDGIADLDWKLTISANRFHDSDIALQRFLVICKALEEESGSFYYKQLLPLASRYLESVTSLSWNGNWLWDRLKDPGRVQRVDNHNEVIFRQNALRRQVNRLLRKMHLPELPMLHWESQYYPKRIMRMSILPDNFLTETRKFTDSIINLAYSGNAPFIVFDQLTPPANPQRYHKYFTHRVKTISVSRDPRDLYLFSVLKDIPFIAHDSVDDFILWYRANNQAALKQPDDNVLYLRYEDMIYEYESTVEVVKRFLGIDGEPTKLSFDPAVSAINTKLFLRYPQYSEAIMIISEKLQDYLYDFDTHKPVEVKQGVNIF